MSTVIAQYSFPQSVQKMDATENLPVLELSEGLKVKDDGLAAKATKQTNPLREPAHSQLAMREFPDLDPGTAAAHQIARASRVSRPDTQINDAVLCRRDHFASRRRL
jgi:hypothetical protein